jgi:large subunit ribosomal protein L15
MQLHQLKPKNKNKKARRIGRGGKRGTFSGHGSKGQKSRAGTRIRPGFRGGDNPIWKLFPKQRGAGKKMEVKNAGSIKNKKSPIVDLDKINSSFEQGDKITIRTLLKKGLINSTKGGVKILGDGELTKKFEFSGVKVSKSAKEKIEKSGGTVK